MLTGLLALPARYWLGLSVVALAVLTVLSLLPLPAPPGVAGSDKLLHLVAWGLAVIPAALALGWRVLPVIGVFLAWSIAIEFAQPFAGRFFEVADMIANVVGLSLGAGLGIALRWLTGLRDGTHVHEA
ncbi:MAG: VanZ family protein [Chromatocurvus sp.]